MLLLRYLYVKNFQERRTASPQGLSAGDCRPEGPAGCRWGRRAQKSGPRTRGPPPSWLWPARGHTLGTALQALPVPPEASSGRRMPRLSRADGTSAGREGSGDWQRHSGVGNQREDLPLLPQQAWETRGPAWGQEASHGAGGAGCGPSSPEPGQLWGRPSCCTSTWEQISHRGAGLSIPSWPESTKQVYRPLRAPFVRRQPAASCSQPRARAEGSWASR